MRPRLYSLSVHPSAAGGTMKLHAPETIDGVIGGAGLGHATERSVPERRESYRVQSSHVLVMTRLYRKASTWID